MPIRGKKLHQAVFRREHILLVGSEEGVKAIIVSTDPVRKRDNTICGSEIVKKWQVSERDFITKFTFVVASSNENIIEHKVIGFVISYSFFNAKTEGKVFIKATDYFAFWMSSRSLYVMNVILFTLHMTHTHTEIIFRSAYSSKT